MSVQRKIAIIGLSFGAAGFACGLALGRMTSIDYSKPATAVNFVALYANWKHIDSTHGSLTLRAGNRIYSFTTGDSKVSKKYLSAAELAESQPPRLNFEQDMDKLTSLIVGGAPSAGITAALLKMSQPTPALGIVEQEQRKAFDYRLSHQVGRSCGRILFWPSN